MAPITWPEWVETDSDKFHAYRVAVINARAALEFAQKFTVYDDQHPDDDTEIVWHKCAHCGEWDNGLDPDEVYDQDTIEEVLG